MPAIDERACDAVRVPLGLPNLVMGPDGGR